MARYQYEKSEVDQSLSLLQEAVKIIYESEDDIQKGLNNLEATGIEAYLNDYGTVKNNLKEIATTSAEYVNKLYSSVDSKAKEIEEFNGKSDWSKFWASVGMGTLKVVEGVASVVEGIADGALTLIGWACNLLGGGVAALFNGIGTAISGKGTFWDGAKAGWNAVSDGINNTVGNWVKKDVVGDAFASAYAEGGWLNGLEKTSYFSSQGAVASVLKGVGTVTGYILIGAATGGAGAGGAIANGILTGAATAGQATQRNLKNQGDNMNFFGASTEGLVEGAIAGTLAYGASKAKAAKTSSIEKPKPEIEGQMDMFSEMDKASPPNNMQNIANQTAQSTENASKSLLQKGKDLAASAKNSVKNKAVDAWGKAVDTTGNVLHVDKIATATQGMEKLATSRAITSMANTAIGGKALKVASNAVIGLEGIANTSSSVTAVRANDQFNTFDLKGTTAEEDEKFQKNSEVKNVQTKEDFSAPAEAKAIDSNGQTTSNNKDTASFDINNNNNNGNGNSGGGNSSGGGSNVQYRVASNSTDSTPTQSVTQVEKPSTDTTPKQSVTQIDKNPTPKETTPSTKTNPTDSTPKTENPAPADKPSFNDDNLKQTPQTQSYDPGTIGGGSSSYNNGGYTYSGGESSYGDYSTEDPIDVASVTTEAGDENIMGDSSVGLGNLASSITNTQSYKNQTIKIPTTTGTVDEGSTNVAIPTAAALSAAAAAGIGAKAYVDYKENHKESEDEEESYEDGEENNGFYTEEWNGSEDDMKIDYGNEEEATLDDDDDYKYSANSIIQKYEDGNNLDLEEA